MDTNKVIASNLIKVAKKLIAGTDNPLDSKEFNDFAKKLDSSKKSFNEFEVEFNLNAKYAGGKVTGAVLGPNVNYPMYISNASVHGVKIEENLKEAKVFLNRLVNQVSSLKNAIAYCEKVGKDLQGMADKLPDDVKKALRID